MKIKSNSDYRYDIDGLRAIAVIVVFFFHAGYLSNGFLGVDVFFVISGFLITRILYVGFSNNSLSIFKFYIRRIRRIIPLVLFFCFFSIIFGIWLMLPDDLENLSQSVIATIGFSNNILLCLTTENYWEVINEFKPLMHTWSLGIEEQFYFLYPLILLLIKNRKTLFIVLFTLSVLSLFMYFQVKNQAYVFYLLPFRFFELSLGGLAAVLLVFNQIQIRFKFLLLLLLLYLLTFGLVTELSKLNIPITCLITVLLLSTTDKNGLCDRILKNRILTKIGKISFSVYMWHQFLFAYTRYFLVQEITINISILIFFFTLILSSLTYRIIETPFRNKNIISNQLLLKTLLTASTLILVLSFFIYSRAGVLKDIPELEILASSYERNMHAKYVKNVNSFPKKFSKNNKLNILVYGNSFARDWTNVLRESVFRHKINIVCISNIKKNIDLAKEADIIFLANLSKTTKQALSKKNINDLNKSIREKIWCVGTKNFGISNGIFYNRKGKGYCQQRTKMEKGYLEENNNLKKEWGLKYIDIIGFLIDEELKVPVFTPNCKFISQDTRHLTQSGAKYLASITEKKIENILKFKK